jgi:hypothetical protein
MTEVIPPSRFVAIISIGRAARATKAEVADCMDRIAGVFPLPLAGFLSPLNESSLSVVSVVCAVLMAAIVLFARRKITGSTLIGPWWWCLAALAALGLTEAAIAAQWVRSAEPLRFAAAVGVFSPWMSLLGAKRPQDAAWHFIVASLWGIQAMPAAEALWLKPGQPLAIVDFRAYLLLGLMVLALLVYLPTRFWLSAILAAAGQFALCWNFLPWTLADNRSTVIGMVCLLLGAIAALVSARRPSPAPPLDRVWLDFRDRFGALWGARVLERINADAALRQAPMRLGWSGFCSADRGEPMAEIPPEARDELRLSFVNLLRRFVTVEWIDATLTRRASED